ncbi:MAG: glycosyltransferase family 2 protein [Planctomycetes bacterium]|nr:glycosyltransferase family 2 protein [Planctomycetota bacterium]
MTDTAPDQPSSLDLSVIIPAYNEEGAIGPEIDHLHQALGGSGIRYELVVVDDGSSDRTAEIAAGKDCRLLRQGRNRGYGAALKRGISDAQAELIAITDADGTYPPEALPELFRLAAENDMVIASRTGEKVHIPLLRRPAKWFLRVLASWLSGTRIPDLNSGMRIMRRSTVRRFAHILPPGFSFTTTITLAVLTTHGTVHWHPINYGKRLGTSKIRASHAWEFTLLILRVIVLFNPLKVFLPLGLVLFLAGAAKFAYDVTKDNLSESAVMAILGAIIIWSLGLLADQNSRLGLDRETWPR